MAAIWRDGKNPLRDLRPEAIRPTLIGHLGIEILGRGTTG